jgi:hypothetical protein
MEAELTEQNPDARWHLDKKVPVALIVTIALQTGGFVWWAASLGERVNTLEREARAAAPQGERIVRLETRMETILEGISEIKRLLRKD